MAEKQKVLVKEKSKFGNFQPDKIRLVTLYHVGRSSSVFTVGLFDGHSEFMVLPSFFYPMEIKKTFEENSIYCFEESKNQIKNVVGDLCNKFSYSDFRKHFEDYIKNFGISRRNCFIATYYSFAKLMDKNVNHLKYILYDPHTIDKTKVILSDFPRQRFIVTTRDPRNSFLSNRKEENALHGIMEEKRIFSFYKNRIKKMRHLVVRHEDIHTNYEKVLASFEGFFNIKRCSSLYQSTYFGVDYDSKNSQYKSTHKIFSSEPNPLYAKERWKEELSPYEIRFVQILHRAMFKEFNYKFYDPFLKPRFFFFRTRMNFLDEDIFREKSFMHRVVCRAIILVSKIPFLGIIFLIFLQLFYHFLTYLRWFFKYRNEK